MSLYSALYAGVSGLSAQSAAMAGVADNITNINTVGYKGVETQFRTLVTDGKAKSTYSAGGVAAAPQSLVSKQGMLQASSSSTDLGIDGGGFFVTRSGAGADSPVAFTRAGSFKADDEGFLRNTSGYYLQGWRLDAAGGIDDTGNVDTLEPVRVSELSGTAAPSTKVQMRANLQSTAAPYAGTPAYAAGTIASGAVTPTFTRSVDVYDAQGGAHRMTLGFLKTAANEWVGEVYANPDDLLPAGGNGLLASGTLIFNPDGSFDLAQSRTETGATSATDAGSLTDLFGTIQPTWSNGAGSEPIALALGSQDGLDGLTQFGGESAAVVSADGGMLGNIASIQVSEEGIVSAVFDDGTARPVFQLPLATFANPDGLTRVGGNAYAVSDASGSYAINKPGSLGSGAISASTLEASNVDLAQEFTNMIRFQRAYSASSKIITTVDDMLQEVSNLKR